jgi:hypothetical protein
LPVTMATCRGLVVILLLLAYHFVADCDEICAGASVSE